MYYYIMCLLFYQAIAPKVFNTNTQIFFTIIDYKISHYFFDTSLTLFYTVENYFFGGPCALSLFRDIFLAVTNEFVTYERLFLLIIFFTFLDLKLLFGWPYSLAGVSTSSMTIQVSLNHTIKFGKSFCYSIFFCLLYDFIKIFVRYLSNEYLQKHPKIITSFT
jgi:hypothetical protein